MNEREIINLLGQSKSVGHKGLVRGIGDDCAVLQLDKECLSLVTMDTLVESVHFNLDWHPPEKLGRKSVAVNVSDIAAMGGKPLYIFLSLSLPRDFDCGWLELFSQGVTAACREFDCCLAGGDTVHSSEGIVITLTVIGEVMADQVLYRSKASPGDGIWVSGTLGNAAAGLELCRQDLVGDRTFRSLVESHLNPQPRLHLARRLAASGLVHAMMDLSDGLATDLAHMCEQSNVGAVIHEDLLPVDELLLDSARLLEKDYLSWAVAGGEDYELLFTAPRDHDREIVQLAGENVSLRQVGQIDGTGRVRLRRKNTEKKDSFEEDISYLGYDHFGS